CPVCDGLGVESFFDPELVVPDDRAGLAEGAIVPWTGAQSPYYDQTLQSLARHYQQTTKTPWRDLPQEVRQSILYGSGDESIAFTYKDGLRSYTVTKPFEGVLKNLQRRWQETDSVWVREEMARYQGEKPCVVCNGARLKPEALSVRVAGKNIAEGSELSIRAALGWFAEVLPQLTPQRQEIAGRILREIVDRLRFLVDVGLDYLTLARGSATLSGGESQRIRLASQIGSGLTGVLYVLDEPSIGLHQRDNERLLGTLRRLRDLGNTVLVVEHDEEAIRAADHLIDMGPAAGINGGHVIAEGTPAEVAANPKSLTGDYLSGRRMIPIPVMRRPMQKERALKVVGARGNNLKNISAGFPIGTFTCVTGVSGGGKSTLVIDTLYKAAARRLMGASTVPTLHDRIEGLDQIDKIIDIDQSPIGRTPRSNPATYTDLFAPIRDWFAELPEARARGYKPGRFSFNVKGGRCEACQGDGLLKIEMHFLPDVYVTCDTCKGRRYNRETLEIKFRDKSIAEVLAMTVDEAVPYFSAQPRIHDRLKILQQVGLGYIALGQQATTLSGGEAQRIKLSKELARRATGRTLYILDEPTTGLHFEDVRKLLEVLHTLVDQGNTVVVIEHNLEVIKTADWILDLGPEGGDGGGRIVAEGTPEDIVANPESYTGRFLAPLLPAVEAPKRTRRRA
ncbi:MAG: excinuclease subunit, partial [Acetobacteraceae bacterium]|nr:excinuclease subunit [Acetobacteraceae bacterium]